jgi:hypothetical protein
MTTTAATRDAAAVETWVSAFAAGWRDPSSPEAFIEHFAPLLDPDVRMIQPQIPDLIGLEAFRAGFVEPIFGLIPDLHGTVRGWAADGNVVWIELELEGNVGGRTVRLDTVDRITLRDGLAVERKAVLDPGPLLAAVARSPRSWPRFMRVQAAGLRRRLSR